MYCPQTGILATSEQGPGHLGTSRRPPRGGHPGPDSPDSGYLGTAIPPPSPDSGPDPGYLGTGGERSGGPAAATSEPAPNGSEAPTPVPSEQSQAKAPATSEQGPGYLGTRGEGGVPLVAASSPQTPLGVQG